MRPYVIRQGDYLASLAARFGFDEDEVWQHDDNRELRELRGSPNILHPGDVLHIPEPAEERREALQPSTTNRYRAQVAMIPVQVTVRREGEVLRNAACEVTSLSPPLETTTDGDGLLSIDVPRHLDEVRVAFTEHDFEMALRVGHLDPIDHDSGVSSRLENLGYLLPEAMFETAHPDFNAPEIRRRRIQLALSYFQRAQGIEPSGELDDETRDALRTAHGA